MSPLNKRHFLLISTPGIDMLSHSKTTVKLHFLVKLKHGMLTFKACIF